MRVKQESYVKYSWLMQQAIGSYCDIHESLYPDCDKKLHFFTLSFQREVFELMWNHQLVKWLGRSYEIKLALKSRLSKVLDSETSVGDLQSGKKNAEAKLFDLKTLTKFVGIRSELSKHPLD